MFQIMKKNIEIMKNNIKKILTVGAIIIVPGGLVGYIIYKLWSKK